MKDSSKLLQILEPESRAPKDLSGYAIGIDLGTTNSVVACVIAGENKILGPILPSVYQNIHSIKRLMGSDERVNDLTPIEISSYILAELKEQAENILGEEVTKAVITVPAYFDDNARSSTKAAARMAGLEVLRLINEPTSAAVAYGLDNNAEGIYLIYDLGGGTFDVSILDMKKGVFQVLATGGDTRLGGDDIDNHIMTQLNLPNHLLARQAKEYLSDKQKWQQDEYSLSRDELNEIVRPFIAKTIEICQETIKNSKIKLEKIKEVILVGGSTRIPLLKEMLASAIKPALDNINPDTVVANGAAIQADALLHGSSNLLLDVTSLSIGLEVMGGMNECVIKKNSTIPISVTKYFTTYKDGQTGIIFHIVQGERDMVKDCRSLAKFELKSIPPMKASAAKVAITFNVDADGLLTVLAVEETTGVHQQIEVKPSYGLSEIEVEEMIMASYANAAQDIAAKQLAELKLKASNNIKNTIQAIEEDGDLLIDQKSVILLISQLQNLLQHSNFEEIEEVNNNLENKASPFLQDRLNRQIKLALQGGIVNDIYNNML